jgi:hypothetical protein
MHFENLGSIFGGNEKASPGGRKSRKSSTRKGKSSFRTNRGRVDPYKNFKFRAKKTRKKPTLSPAVRAQRRLQGQYMGKIRRLPKAQQAKVKKMRETKGYEAALNMMG